MRSAKQPPKDSAKQSAHTLQWIPINDLMPEFGFVLCAVDEHHIVTQQCRALQ
jgi:hypothetical protein